MFFRKSGVSMTLKFHITFIPAICIQVCWTHGSFSSFFIFYFLLFLEICMLTSFLSPLTWGRWIFSVCSVIFILPAAHHEWSIYFIHWLQLLQYGHALKLSELSNGFGDGPGFKNTVHSYSFLTFGMKIPLYWYGQIMKTVSMLEAALSPEGSKCSNKRSSFSRTPEPRLLPTRLWSQGLNMLSSLPFTHPFPFGGCYDSPSSGSPTSAFVRHLGRGWELNFAPAPGLPTWPRLPAPTQVGHHELLNLRSGSLQSPELHKWLGFPKAFGWKA